MKRRYVRKFLAVCVVIGFAVGPVPASARIVTLKNDAGVVVDDVLFTISTGNSIDFPIGSSSGNTHGLNPGDSINFDLIVLDSYLNKEDFVSSWQWTIDFKPYDPKNPWGPGTGTIVGNVHSLPSVPEPATWVMFALGITIVSLFGLKGSSSPLFLRAE